MLRVAAVIVLSMAFFTSDALATQFIDGMDDVPLPENMSQITQDDFSFGNEETRLLEAYLTESKNKQKQKIKFTQIGKFYQEFVLL